MAETPGLNADVGITLNRLTRQLAQAEARMVKAAKRSETAFQQSNRRAATSYRQVDIAAQRSLSNIERLSNRASASIAGLAKGGVAGIVATVGFRALQRNISGTISELSNLGKEADRIGIGIEPLQGLQRGFALAGVSATEATSGLEQFGKRVGEAANGAGTLLPALQRYGVQLRNNDGSLRSQIDLLKDFADILKAIPNEQQRLALANEAFGRSGLGFVNALRGGSEALDGFIRDGKEGGFVIEESLIRKAEELDDRFADLQRRAGVFFKSFAVGAADAVNSLITVSDALDDVFPEVAANRAILGADIADALVLNADAALAAEDANKRLRLEYDALQAAAAATAGELERAVPEALLDGYDGAAAALGKVAIEIRAISKDLTDGAIEGAEFERRIRELADEASVALGTIDQIDAVSFQGAIAGVTNLIGALGRAVTIAETLRGTLPSTAANASKAQFDTFREAELASRAAADIAASAAADFLRTETERNAKSRERLDIERETASVQADALETGVFLTQAQAEVAAQARIDAEAARAAAARADSGASKPSGGGSARPDEAAEEIKRQSEARRALLDTVEDQVARLELELDLVGQSVESTARLTAQFELLNQAKRAGLDLDAVNAETGKTLREEIDGQAAAVGRLTAELDRKNQSTEFFVGLQMQLVDGLIDAAVAGGDLAGVFQNLAVQIAKAAAQALLFGTGPLAGTFGSTAGVGLFRGFSGGGYTGDGGKFEPKGVVHGGEYVFSKQATQRIGVKNLERMHKQMRGYSGGGHVGGGGGTAVPAVGGTTILNLLDPSIVGQYLRTPEGEKLIVNTMRANQENG